MAEAVEEAVEEVEEAVEEEAEPLVIGWIILSLQDPYQIALSKWVESTAADMNVDVRIVDGNFDAALISSQVDDFVAQGVDGIVLQPIDPAAINTAIADAQAAGIPITPWAIEPSEKLAPFGFLAEEDLCIATGELAATKWQEWYPDKPIKIGTFNIPAVAACDIFRTKAFVQGVMNIAPDAEWVLDLDTGGARDVAYSSAEDMLQSNPEVNIVYGCNDNSSLGALAAFQAAGRGLAENGIPLTELFVGTGGTEGEMLAIADPNSPMKLTMAMNPSQNAVDIMNLILDTISGKIDRLAYSEIPIPGTNIDAWSWTVDELEAYAHDVYFSELDFKAELGLE